jgi:hypothetical protein
MSDLDTAPSGIWLVQDGQLIAVTNLIDAQGEDIQDIAKADCIIAGPMPDGRWACLVIEDVVIYTGN